MKIEKVMRNKTGTSFMIEKPKKNGLSAMIFGPLFVVVRG